MSGAVIVLPRERSSARQDLAELLVEELRAQGVPVDVVEGAAQPPVPDRVVIVVGPLALLEPGGFDAFGDARAMRRTILIADEAPSALGDERYLALLRRAGAVFVLDGRTAGVHRRYGSAARLLRLGYVATRDRFDPDAERPLDIVLCGERTARREREAAHAGRVLSRRCHEPWPQDESSVFIRAKVAINLHPEDGDPRLRWKDVLPAIHAGAVVVSEHATGLDPLIAGEHLLVARSPALSYVAEGLLADESRLDEMRRAAHHRIVGWLPFALSVSMLRLSIVQLAGQPRLAAHGSGLRLKSPLSSR